MGKNTGSRAGVTGPIESTTGTYKTSEYVLQEKGGFGVFAYHVTGVDGESKPNNWTYTGATTYAPDFMYNQKVEMNADNGKDGSTAENAKDVSTWKYSPIKYWPNEFASGDVDANNPNAQGATARGNVSFFAYGPYVASSEIAAGATADITGLNNASDVTIDKAKVNTAASYSSATGIIAMTTNDYAGHPYLEYRLAKPGSIATTDNVDLLWGTAGTNGVKATGEAQVGATLAGGLAAVNVNLNKMKTDGKIQFNFKHALAGVGGSTVNNTSEVAGSGLTIVYDLDEAQTLRTSNVTTKVTVKNITITNDLDGDANIEDNGDYGDERIIRSGVFNLATGQWKNSTTDYFSGTEAVYSQTIVNGTPAANQLALNPKIAEPTSAPATSWFDHAENGGENPGVNTTALNVYKDQVSPFLFIPGTKPAFKITITYVTRTLDANLAKGYSEVEQTVSKILKFTNNVELNKKYAVKIILGLTSVKFDAIVSNWSFVGDTDGDGELDGGETVSVETVDIPKNVTPAP